MPTLTIPHSKTDPLNVNSSSNYVHSSSPSSPSSHTLLNKAKTYYGWYMSKVGYLNSLLFFAPIAIGFRIAGSNPTFQFFSACVAIIPLAGLLGDATENLSDHLGPGAGGLLNATFGNAAELIIASFSVFRGLDTLVKSSLVGSIIGNLLLVLGASILMGGIKFSTQRFSINAANIDSNMTVVAAIGFLVPSMFHHFGSTSNTGDEHHLSLGISLVFLITYIFMLFFQLRTHSHFFDRPEEPGEVTPLVPHPPTSLQHHHPSGAHRVNQQVNGPPGTQISRRAIATSSFHIPRSYRPNLSSAKTIISPYGTSKDEEKTLTPNSSKGRALEHVAASLERAPSIRNNLKRDEFGVDVIPVSEEGSDDDDENEVVEEEDEPWTMKYALIVLTLATLVVVVLSEILTGAVEETGESLHLSHLFVGVVIVAIVGNAAEHTTAVMSSLHNDMDIAISISFGSALQIAMFCMPVIVLLSYFRDSSIGPMDLTLSEFEVFGVTCAAVISWMVVQDGEANWLEGLMLLVIYFILAMAFFFTANDSASVSQPIGHVQG